MDIRSGTWYLQLARALIRGSRQMSCQARLVFVDLSSYGFCNLLASSYLAKYRMHGILDMKARAYPPKGSPPLPKIYRSDRVAADWIISKPRLFVQASEKLSQYPGLTENSTLHACNSRSWEFGIFDRSLYIWWRISPPEKTVSTCSYDSPVLR